MTLVVAAPAGLVDELWEVRLYPQFALESDRTIVGVARGKIS